MPKIITKIPAKDMKKKNPPLKKNKNEESSSSSSDESSSSEDDENNDLDMHEYRKELAKLFPSKHIENKISAGEKFKSSLNKNSVATCKGNDCARNTRSKTEDKNSNKDKNKDKNKDSNKDKNKTEDKEDDSSESESESESEDSAPNKSGKKSARNKINIVFTIGSNEEGYEDDDDEDWETDSYSDEDEDDDDEEEEDEDVEVSDSDEDEQLEVGGVTVSKKSSEDSLKTAENLLSTLMNMRTNNSDDKILKECMKACETTIVETKTKLTQQNTKQKAKNERIFKKILKQKNSTNDFTFFKRMEMEQQKKIIKELREINKFTQVDKPYRLSLLESSMPIVFKAAAMKRVNTLKHMDQGSGEYYKIKNWVDTFMKIPFGVYETLPVNISDGVDNCHAFMEGALSKLNAAVYGLNDAKMQIMQMLGQLISNPSSIGTSIAIHGPMGTGKTSLVREGISKILNRPFAFIALGGATDSSFLEGHSYTYEGSTWGQIVQFLIASKCMNPVIYFDELDKISDTPKGEEIASILTHLTDSSQNSQFHDKYFSDIDFDLSKCLFIFSYNDESKINPILRDRMYKIKTSGYNMKQKVTIANKYLLPRIREQVKFDEESIIIPDESLQYIIDNHCGKEEGVRNLKRCLEVIYTKLNLYRLMKPGTNLFEQEITLKVEFPFVVHREMVDKIVKICRDTGTWKNLYN